MFGQFSGHYEVTDNGSRNHYRLTDQGSRIGVKGAGIIDGQREYTYLFEVASDIAENNDVFGEVRQAWAGVRTADSEVRVGRHLSPTRVSVVPVDMFADQAADQNKVLEGDKISDKSLVFLGHLNEFAYALAFSVDDSNEHTATDLLVNYTNEQSYFSAAYLRGYDQQRVARIAATYRFAAGHRLGAAAEYLRDTGTGDDHKAYVISAGYQFNPKLLYKLQLGANQSSAGGRTETLLGIGGDYALTDNTQLKLQYSVNKHTDHQDAEERTLSVGLVHKF
ncbi:MAG: porin [Thiolinea sp.]